MQSTFSETRARIIAFSLLSNIVKTWFMSPIVWASAIFLLDVGTRITLKHFLTQLWLFSHVWQRAIDG